jgi:hypothetical protein
VTQATIVTHIHEALDVLANFAAQITFDHVVAVNRFANAQNFRISQILDTTIVSNANGRDDLEGFRRTDTMDIRERDFYALIGRDIYPSDTSHNALPSSWRT